MAVNEVKGNSIYVTELTEKRAQQPLYVAVTNLVHQYSQTKQILDLGCSDGVSSWGLQTEGYQVFGIDGSKSAMKVGQAQSKTHFIQADLSQTQNLPFRSNEIDTVILADVLEHLSGKQAVDLLTELPKHLTHPNLHVIVSMPNLSIFSAAQWKERIKTIKSGSRPMTGLYDRTRQILTDTYGHRKLFAQAGYNICFETYTNWREGVHGRWDNIDSNELPLNWKRFIKNGLLYTVAPAVISLATNKELEDTMMDMHGYQGVYVLKPN